MPDQTPAVQPSGVTAERLDEIERRAAAASDGPWQVERGFDWDTDEPGRYVRFGPASDSTIMRRDEDAEFIAAARQDVPDLVAALREANSITEQAIRVAAERGDRIVEYEAAITWDVTCLNCSHLLDQLYAADARRQAVLDLHQPVENVVGQVGGRGRRTRTCSHCAAREWPCPTVVALGVGGDTPTKEADHG